jgi:excisionase family DNA binding protein
MAARTSSDDDDPDALDVPAVCRLAKLGRSFVYEEIRAGRLVARKFGRLTRVLRADFDAWLASAPPISPAPTSNARTRTPGPNPATELYQRSAPVNLGDDRRAKSVGPADRPEVGHDSGPALDGTNPPKCRRGRTGARR